MSNLFNFEEIQTVSLDELVSSKFIELGRGDIISKIDIRNNIGDFPIYSSSAKNDGRMGEYGKYMFDEELITWSIDGGGNFFYREKHKFSVTNVSGYMRVDQSKFDYKFLHYILDYQHKYLRFDYQAKAHPSVIRELYEVPLLPMAEQKKISKILSSIEAVISNLNIEIEKIDYLKQGTLDKLLFDGINAENFHATSLGKLPSTWSVTKLSDHVINHVGGASFSPDDFTQDGIQVIPKKSIQYGGKVIFDDETFCSKDYAHSNKTHCVDKEYVVATLRDLVPTGPTIGLICEIQSNKNYILAQGVYGFKLSESLNKQFLCQLSNSSWYRKLMRLLYVGSTQVHIRTSEFLEIEIPTPPIKEQEEMLKILAQIDEHKKLKAKALEKYEMLKRALINSLLSGDVRVKYE